MLNSTHKSILGDFSKVLPMLTREENKVALECALRIKSHMERALAQTGDQKFVAKLEVVEEIIQEHKKLLKSAYYNWELGLAS